MNIFVNKIWNTHKDTIHNFLWRFLQIFGKQGTTFIIFLLCAKLLTSYDFGIYNYTLAIIYFLILFGDFGISAATSKYVAEYDLINKEKLKLVLFNSSIVILSLTIIITFIIIAVGPGYFKEKYLYIFYLTPLIFLVPMTSLYDGIYRGLKKFKKVAVISLVVSLVSLPFIFFLIKTYSLTGALIAQNIFYLVLLISLGLGYKEFSFKWNGRIIREIGKYSLIIGIYEVGYFFYSGVDVLILGQFGYINEIGYYETLNKIFGIIVLPFMIFGQISAPGITKMYVLKKYNEVKTKFLTHLHFSLILSILISIIIYFLLPILMNIFLKNQFTVETIKMFSILIWVLPMRLVSGIIGQAYTTSTGNARYPMYTLLVAGVANIILDFFFIWKYGFLGVVYSTVICCTFAVSSFILLFYLKLNFLSKNKNN